MTITNGTIKYGQTVKTGDYENKRGDVELSFTLAEGQSVDEELNHARSVAHGHLHSMLGINGSAATVAAPKAPQPAKKAVAKHAVVEKVAETDEEILDRTPHPSMPKPPVAKAVVAENKKAAEVVEENLDDLLGTEEVAKEITDKEMTDATQRCQAANKNSPAIRKVLNECGVKAPPGRIIDIPQAKRQEYLDKLAEIKPLA